MINWYAFMPNTADHRYLKCCDTTTFLNFYLNPDLTNKFLKSKAKIEAIQLVSLCADFFICTSTFS